MDFNVFFGIKIFCVIFDIIESNIGYLMVILSLRLVNLMRKYNLEKVKVVYRDYIDWYSLD